MKAFKISMAIFSLVLALGVAFLSKGKKTSVLRTEQLLPNQPSEIRSGSPRVQLGRLKPLELKWDKPKEGISMKDLRIMDVRTGVDPGPIEEEKIYKSNKIEFRLRPSEDLYWKFQENNFDVESALKDIDFKKPPVKGEIKINF